MPGDPDSPARPEHPPCHRRAWPSPPWTDLTCSSESYRTNARRDISTLGSWEIWSSYYIGDNDPKHPWLSPLHADLHGLPPVMLQVGDDEILLDDSTRFAEKAKAAGVDVTLQVWEGWCIASRSWRRCSPRLPRQLMMCLITSRRMWGSRWGSKNQLQLFNL